MTEFTILSDCWLALGRASSCENFPQCFCFIMVLTIHGTGTPKNTSQALSFPADFRKKALNPGRKTEWICARMMGKSPNVQFEIQFLVWNVESMLRKWGEISETLKRRCVDIC